MIDCVFFKWHTYPAIFENRAFFSGYGFRPHVNGVFGNRNRSFENVLQTVDFFSRVFLEPCGQRKTEVCENDDILPRF